MKLTEYLAAIKAATTAAELETALQSWKNHPFHGNAWAQICKNRIAAGHAICDAHPHGSFVPRLNSRRTLTVCGETYGVGRGQNSTGIRYVWHSAEQFAMKTLTDNGLSQTAAHNVWNSWSEYPHRALAIVEAGLAGQLPDPPLHVLISTGKSLVGPIQIGKDERDQRGSRPCACGGNLWDWGSSWNGWTNFINWRCDACDDTFTEYVDNERLIDLRTNLAA